MQASPAASAPIKGDIGFNCKCSLVDPFTKFLRVFFEHILAPSLPLWDPVKLQISGDEFITLREYLVHALIADYNWRLLLKTAHYEMYKEPSKFPSVFVEHYNTNETLAWTWRQFVVKQWPSLRGVPPPEISICYDMATDVALQLSAEMKVESVIEKRKWKVAAFILNPKEVLQKSIKYLLTNYNCQDGPEEAKVCRSHPFESYERNYNVELAIKDTDEDSEPNARVLLSRCVFRLCRGLNYRINCSKDKQGHSEDDTELQYFTVIPQSIPTFTNTVLASFEGIEGCREQSDTLLPDQVLIELNSKEFYDQYSETVVILYNYARIKSILERYESLSEGAEYPELPPLDQVDFNLIAESKEEFPIILMLLMWPRVRKNIVNIQRKGKGFDKLTLPFLFDFVKSLARTFDSFYNRNIIIVPPSASHNFRSMFARLYLSKAVSVIFKEFIYLTGIEMD